MIASAIASEYSSRTKWPPSKIAHLGLMRGSFRSQTTSVFRLPVLQIGVPFRVVSTCDVTFINNLDMKARSSAIENA